MNFIYVYDFTVQNPNSLDSKVLVDFDHVKKNLKIVDEGEHALFCESLLCLLFCESLIIGNLHDTYVAELKKMESDPSYSININGDIKQMLKELGTEQGQEIALHGGGGNKAKNERAAALAAILAARSRIKDNTEPNGGEKPKQTYSVVDAASAAVHGRSAAAAKSDVSNKTAARIAMHMAGERTPVNARLVSIFCL